MYHALLTNRYLTSRVIPLIAVAAVAMCVGLVIIVVSVMTGFLDMVKNSGRTLMGDVVVSCSISGLPFYERLIDEIEALPETKAVTPVVDGWGLLKMPYPEGDWKQTETVQVWGVDPDTFGDVTGYVETLYWRRPTSDEAAEMGETDFRRSLSEAIGDERLAEIFDNGKRLEKPGSNLPGIVLGMHVSIGNERQKDGTYRPVLGPRGYWWMPQFEVILTVVPVTSQGGLLDPVPRAFQVVNEFVSGVFLIDDRRVMVPLAVAQEMMHLDEAERYDDEGEATGEFDPARATMVLVRAVDGVTPDALRARVAEVYERFREKLLQDEAVRIDLVPPPLGGGVLVQMWRQQQSQFIDPIEKERELMRVLFSIIYLVCAGLVLSIFWAIVYEKTRDIGILRSIGASRFGISFIFLRYGAIIGVFGAIIGLVLAYLVVHNINAIHTAMGEPAPPWAWITAFVLAAVAAAETIRRCFGRNLLPIVLWSLATIVCGGLGAGLMAHRGTLIWDPSVYYFSRIPNVVDPVAAVTTMIGAVVFSVLGAFVPATRAADTDPVEAGAL